MNFSYEKLVSEICNCRFALIENWQRENDEGKHRQKKLKKDKNSIFMKYLCTRDTKHGSLSNVKYCTFMSLSMGSMANSSMEGVVTSMVEVEEPVGPVIIMSNEVCVTIATGI